MKTISILGCGWLGFRLAIELLQDSNYRIKASTTSKNKIAVLKENGMIPFLINSNDITTNKHLDDFLTCDILIIAVPAKKENPNYIPFLQKISNHKKMSEIQQIIFISSTSIYPQIRKNMTEQEIIPYENCDKKTVYEAEQLFLEHTILRCAGLMGYNRVAGQYFANKTIDGRYEQVNYVHVDDVISSIQLIINKQILKNIYNLCSPKHPTKEEVYCSNAIKYNFEKPLFKEAKKDKNRLIDGSKISKELGFVYKYQNPIDFV